ncbi:hypothetical protein Angca_006454 [Angiostrongylus cantonensis]|nr:hypothetical protein Angca_006454 [Angiostrongylus cantonensis]
MQRQKRVTDFFSSSSTKETPTNTRTPFFELETKPIVKKKLRLSIDENDLKQTILDFGQTCGGQYCKQCDMMYSIVSAAEVKLHEEHHNRFANISEVQISLYCLNLWLRKECHYLSKHGYIFRIRPDSKSSLRRRVEKVIEDFVNTSLGFCFDLSIWGWDKRRTVWASILNEGSTCYIAGIAITEPLVSAQCSSTGELISDGDPIIGVNRLWTHPTARMKGIAREILDVARKWCFTGILVPKHR